MEDISPQLLELIQQATAENANKSAKLTQLLEKIADGTATYLDAQSLSEETGTALAQAFEQYLTSDVLPNGRLYPNIADKVVRPMLENEYTAVSNATVQVQQSLNKAAGIGIKAQTAPINTDRISGILQQASNAPVYDEVAPRLLAQTKSYALSVVSDTMQANVNFQGKAGLKPKIVRKAGFKCCKWCSALAGTYSYPDVPSDVYRRHLNCTCTVDYRPGDGSKDTLWTKGDKAQQKAQITARDERILRLRKLEALKTKTNSDTIKTKYAPSPQRQIKGIQVSHAKYARLTGTLNTNYPNLTVEDGEVTIFDGNWAYDVISDGFGGMIIQKRIKLE